MLAAGCLGPVRRESTRVLPSHAVKRDRQCDVETRALLGFLTGSHQRRGTAQSSHFKPATCPNPRTFDVTSVAPRRRACPASSTSQAPIGVVTGEAQTGPKPGFGAAGSNWSREGWFVPVDYFDAGNVYTFAQRAYRQFVRTFGSGPGRFLLFSTGLSGHALVHLKR